MGKGHKKLSELKWFSNPEFCYNIINRGQNCLDWIVSLAKQY